MLNKKYSELLANNDSLFTQNTILKKIALINENNNSELLQDSVFVTQAKVLKTAGIKNITFLQLTKGIPTISKIIWVLSMIKV